MDSHDPGPSCHLLAIPAELRLEIWRQVFDGDVVKISRAHRPRIPEPAWLWTCRQIRAEALPAFWAHSIFDGRHVAMLRFFELIGRPNVEMIRHVRHTGHVGLNTLQGIQLTLRILSGVYATMGLHCEALQLPLRIQYEGETWVNLQESQQLAEVWMGRKLSMMPIVRRVQWEVRKVRD